MQHFIHNSLNFHQQESETRRKLFIMRHGERVDFTFGTWIPFCFDEDGKYIRKDLNMPRSLPDRISGPQGYLKDSPLTNIGVLQAMLVGEALKNLNIKIDHVYCSPAFRCIQTCDGVLRGLQKQQELSICIEPGLFEWLVWYPDALPNFLTAEELAEGGFNLDNSYKPFISLGDLSETKESCEQFYFRSNFVSQSCLERHKEGNVLLVGHACTVDVCSRELVGEKPRTSAEMTKLIQKVPYCSLAVVAENGGKWELEEPPCPPVTHSNNPRFDWKQLQ